jgi:hypothetical protein
VVQGRDESKRGWKEPAQQARYRDDSSLCAPHEESFNNSHHRLLPFCQRAQLVFLTNWNGYRGASTNQTTLEKQAHSFT